jgi:hypothetical protein
LKDNRDHLNKVRIVFLRGEEARYEAAIDREELEEQMLDIEQIAEGIGKPEAD